MIRASTNVLVSLIISSLCQILLELVVLDMKVPESANMLEAHPEWNTTATALGPNKSVRTIIVVYLGSLLGRRQAFRFS